MNTSNHGTNQYVCCNGSIDCRYTSQAKNINGHELTNVAFTKIGVSKQ